MINHLTLEALLVHLYVVEQAFFSNSDFSLFSLTD